MCNSQQREPVVMRALHDPEQLVLLPDAICFQCTSNRKYFVNSDSCPSLLLDADIRSSTATVGESHNRVDGTAAVALEAQAFARRMELNDLLRSVQNRAIGSEQQHTPDMPVMSPIVRNDGQVLSLVPLLPASTPSLQSQAIAAVANDRPTASVNISYGRLEDAASKGSWVAQVNAIMRKNATLQSHQQCSNCCVGAFIVFMFLLLYVVGIVLTPLNSIKTCPQGYVSFRDCSMETLVDHLFSASFVPILGLQLDDSPSPAGQDQAYSYGISYVLVPSSLIDSPYSDVTVVATTAGSAGVSMTAAGLPTYSDRVPTVWSDFALTVSLLGELGGLVLNMFPSPREAAEHSSRDAHIDAIPNANAYMYSMQEEVYKSVYEFKKKELALKHPDLQCSSFAPDFLINASSGLWLEDMTEIALDFSSVFADAVFECRSSCAVGGFKSPSTSSAFDGTLWVARSGQGNSVYPYGFLNLASPEISGKFLGDFCPANVEMISLGPAYDAIQTLTSMQYLNLLTNTLYDPTLESYPIQGAVSEFGALFFNLTIFSEIFSLFLTIFAVLMMNGLWPLTVWRLAYERSSNIHLMMKSVGMRESAYLMGMYLFDTLLSSLLGISAMTFVCYCRLSRFDGAPFGYLCLICFASSHALNGVALLVVRIAPKNARLTSLLAACVSIASSVGSIVVMITSYRDEGE